MKKAPTENCRNLNLLETQELQNYIDQKLP